MGSTMELAEFVQSRAWRRAERPFPHFTAANVFTPEYYLRLAASLEEIVARGTGRPGDTTRFSKSIRGYDALALPLSPSMPSPFSIFASRAWHDLLQAITGVNATGEINGGLHWHAPGSSAGRIHNDLNPGWFPARSMTAGETSLSDHRLCNYRTGSSTDDLPTVQRIRCVAMIFYVGNGRWAAGDGGETGLFRSARGDVVAPDVSVPPHDNSLLIFECRPTSYHAYLGNARRRRTSLILWLHQTRADAERLWGSRAIVPWPES